MTSDGLGSFRLRSLSQASQASVCRVLPRPMSSARMPPSRICVEVAEEIEAVLLVGPHLGLHGRGQLDGGHALEILAARSRSALASG